MTVMKKKIILVEELKSDLNEGMSDEELMKKYGLSEKGRKALIDSLLKAISSGSWYIRFEE